MRAAESRQQPNRFARELFDGLAGRYDLLAEVLSMGQNGRWRHALVDAVAAAGPTPGRPSATPTLDVATGTAGVALELASRTGRDVVGVDLTVEMLRVGEARVRERGADGRVRLLAGRAEALPFPDATFEAVTFTYLLRYVNDPAATIAELARVLRPGGTMASLEFHVPPGPLWRPLWVLYTRGLLPVAGFLTGGRDWLEVGRFLGPSITEHYRRYPLAWHVDAWRDAGMRDVEVRTMSLGGGVVMWGRKAGGA